MRDKTLTSPMFTISGIVYGRHCEPGLHRCTMKSVTTRYIASGIHATVSQSAIVNTRLSTVAGMTQSLSSAEAALGCPIADRDG